jgi:hypothetical protein
MYKHNLKVYGEDLLNGSTAGVVKAQGNMGGLVVRVFAKADAQSVGSTDVTIKSGDDGSVFGTTITVLNVASATAVEKDDLLAEAILPWDVEKYVTATAAAGSDAGSGATASTNIVVTLGYLPR